MKEKIRFSRRRRFPRFFLWFLGVLALIALALWFEPRLRWPESLAGLGPVLPAALPTEALDTWLAEREAAAGPINPGTEKTILWAFEPGERTTLALVYLHGFSATRAEIEPVPQDVAKALGANLFLTRLTGHGQDGTALARATPADWARDLVEAVEIGRRLGERVVLIGTSTGGSLAVLSASEPALAADLAGLVLLSPNFGLRDRRAAFLDWPYGRFWLPLIFGHERRVEPANADHARFWTTRYPNTALFTMRAVQRAAAAADVSLVRVPTLVFLAEGDQTVDPAATRAVMARWGGPVEVVVVEGSDDPTQHVIAGRIFSPSTTPAITEKIISWASTL